MAKDTYKYFVLYTDAEGEWTYWGPVDAESSDDAISLAALETPEDDTLYVAVSARSWKPKGARVESTPRVKLYEPKDAPADKAG